MQNSEDFKTKSSKILEQFDRISQFLWNNSDETFKGATRRPYIQEFFKRKNSIKEFYSKSHYLISIGKTIDCKSSNKPFSGGLKGLSSVDLDNINNIIENYYNYIYIPVEQHAQSTLRIENIQMQKIMNQDVVRKIEELLNKKLNLDGRNQSFIDHINHELSLFIEDINTTVKQVDEHYEFKAKRNQKQNLRPSDIVDNILNGYFSKRTLKRSQKEMDELSSGEQRRAMIDIIYAFLQNRGKEEESNGRNVILAIDEPEVSQDITHCFEQFERLEKLSNEFGNQVLVTTHWYGILPVIENGTLLHLSDSVNTEYHNKFSIFDFYNYLDNKESFPDDIQLKSIYDLAISLSTYAKKDGAKHMILCEGGTDKRYLETLIDTTKVRIIPVGGIDNVRNIYRLLVMPLQVERKVNNNRKVLCLTDTDSNIRDNSDLLKDPSGKIQVKRLQINYPDMKLDLMNFDNYNPGQLHSITRIEDVLYAPIWKEILQDIIHKYDQDYNDINFQEYEFMEDSIFTNLRGDTCFLYCKTPKATINKGSLIEFIESKKTELSFLYVEKFKEVLSKGDLKNIPPLFESINGFFKENVLIDIKAKALTL